MMYKRKRNLLVGYGLLLGTMAGFPSIAGTQMKSETINYSHVIELSHEISESIPLWPGDPKVAFKTVATMDEDGYYLRAFSIGEHSATHMNAPNSFVPGLSGIDSYPVSSLVKPVVVIRVRGQSEKNPDYIVSVSDIHQWEKQYGKIPSGSLVFFDTGWGERWQHPDKFFNQDNEGQMHFPGVSGEVTRFLLTERHISGMGIDTHGLDPASDEQYQTNTLLAKNHKIALECVANLEQMPVTGGTVVIGLPRLKNGSGAPVTITAFIP